MKNLYASNKKIITGWWQSRESTKSSKYEKVRNGMLIDLQPIEIRWVELFNTRDIIQQSTFVVMILALSLSLYIYPKNKSINEIDVVIYLVVLWI